MFCINLIVLNFWGLVACLWALFFYLDSFLSKKEALHLLQPLDSLLCWLVLVVRGWSLFVLVLVWYSDNYPSYFTLFFTSSGLCLQF